MVEREADGRSAGASRGSADGIHHILRTCQCEMVGGGDAVVRCGDVIVASGCRCRCTGIVTVEDDPLSSQRIIKLGVERDLVAADATGCQV